ncbi:hypothetical protein SAMN05216319_0370 [Duganella sp. CF402]|uniref:hypothetical protein n=1 Tax=unclassified Duganella TaxID=2636909 RepID=UPI0008D41A09|nr:MULTISPECIES: hypothetical protein [unclassified Duganella]RZT11151.1 hypothetical protein EV582_3256 [Duganella sp. BK701]SEK79024.1 hypothetical protein SAMN05216319_0370 [Duganella sp. CF402]
MRFLTILLPLILASSSACAQYTLKQEQASVGTNLKRDIVTGGRVPFDKRYAELTPEQQAIVKSQYEAMGPTDEPPYPADGLGPVYKLFSLVQERTHATGYYSIAIEIDSQGKPTAVSFLKAEDEDVAKLLAQAALIQKYKPALCNGTPCAMQVPYRIAFNSH